MGIQPTYKTDIDQTFETPKTAGPITTSTITTTTTAATTTTTTTTAPSSNLVRKPILSEFVSLQITFIENKLLCKYKQISQSEKVKNIKRKIRKQATLSPFLSLFPLRRSAEGEKN